MGRDLLLVLHILLLVAWLGIDVGVFYSSFVMRRPGMSSDTRRAIRQVMVTLDLAPRLSLILMVPVGLGLAYLTGFGFATYAPAAVESVLWIVAAIAIAWAAATAWAFAVRPRRPDASAVRIFDRLDWWGRIVVAISFLGLGLWSLGGDGPFVPMWLAWKVTLFGGIVAAGLWIRIAARRYRPALERLLAEGESTERLAAVNESIAGVYPAVLAVWAGLVVMVALSVVRP